MIKQLAPTKPKPPSNLSPEAALLWQSLTAEYDITDSGGILLLNVAMEAFCRMREAQKLLAEFGPITTDAKGLMKPSPAIGIERDSRQGLLGAMRQLNLDILPLRDRIGRPGGS